MTEREKKRETKDKRLRSPDEPGVAGDDDAAQILLGRELLDVGGDVAIHRADAPRHAGEQQAHPCTTRRRMHTMDIED